MINLPASQLRLPRLTNVEKENVIAMGFWNKYKYNLEQAEKHKADLTWIRRRLKDGSINGDNLDAALKLESLCKEYAIDYWNKSQEFLAKYNSFEANRKYKN